ncbi:DUF3566 domain-containing protein [Buchananella felis]|uniref:DUF3566 domain-containing protein n=1 Tax=Buchananella felis TaxID=3231492 RepID=UPI003529652D
MSQSEEVVVADEPRRVNLVIAKVDAWSIMKMVFLLSVALAIMGVVAAAFIWKVLDSMQVFAQIRDLVTAVGADSLLNLLAYTEFNRVVAAATAIGVVNTILFTALATLGAFLYNLSAALVGGIHVTLTDE